MVGLSQANLKKRGREQSVAQVLNVHILKDYEDVASASGWGLHAPPHSLLPSPSLWLSLGQFPLQSQKHFNFMNKRMVGLVVTQKSLASLKY